MADNSVKKTKSNSYFKDLFLLFAIPAAIAVFAALVIYVPRFLANPKYDFIYSVCDDYRCRDSYSVDTNGYVTWGVSNAPDQDYYDRTASLRYYDSANEATKSLTLEEARRYTLNTSSKSPDGYTLDKGSSGSGFLFWDNYDESWYLKNGAKKKKVALTNNGSYHTHEVTFLGWVNK
ncbi:MAG TPA: hypothetical protein VJ836_01675 [Candidatus Saccharimonadales bacterium]|nr:hypothetical protein [Candidatus Saccharimonadales bacterium]